MTEETTTMTTLREGNTTMYLINEDLARAHREQLSTAIRAERVRTARRLARRAERAVVRARRAAARAI